MKYLCIIQARIGSTRFPNKVMQTVGGVSMVKRVWNEAKSIESEWGKSLFTVIVAWPERYPNLDENNVLERFRRIVYEYRPQYVIRLTADCPLIKAEVIKQSIFTFEESDKRYYSNHLDGLDVQIFNPYNCSIPFHNEHVLDDPIKTPDTGLSVNTKEDLERVRRLCKH